MTAKLILGVTIALLFSSCDDNSSITFELDPRTHDTINRRDENGRQGRWVISTDCAKNFSKLPSDTITQFDSVDIAKNQGYIFSTNPSVLEIGNYVDNKKQGTWTYYAEDGSIVKTLEFKNDCPVTK
jgi:hypothetical protein